MPQDVVAAPRVIVTSASRAHTGAVPGEIEALAFMAPTPVRLAGEVPAVVHQIVITASGVIVGSTSGTDPGTIPGEVHALALMTPTPVGLTVRHREIVRDSVVPAPCMIMSAASLADTSAVSGEIHPLTLVAPAPVTLVLVRRPDGTCVLYIVGIALEHPERHGYRLLVAAIPALTSTFDPSCSRGRIGRCLHNLVRYGVLEIAKRCCGRFAASGGGVRANRIVRVGSPLPVVGAPY